MEGAVHLEGEARLAEALKAAMAEAIQKFFDNRLRPSPDPLAPAISERRLALATAALFIEMSRADLQIAPEERRAVRNAVERALGLSPEETGELVELAEREVALSTPLHEFARLIDDSFSPPQKKRVVELLWRIAFSDSEILAHEEYLVRKVSHLLHVPLPDFLEAKIRARDDFRGSEA